MSKFGLIEEEEPISTVPNTPSFSERLAAFPTVAPKHTIDIEAMDAAAAPHGFVSRESSPAQSVPRQQGRRRRIVTVEPTRHLAIRLAASQYDRFVAYADRHKLTYHEALIRLLEAAGE